MNDTADIVHAIESPVTGWSARLALGYEVQGERCVLVHRAHEGPLVVQKSLYPEGDAVCQNIIVHPPGGIVGGDRLALEVAVGEQARVQLTTPGAAKWYRSTGPVARQSIALQVAAGAALEWLPQESILFDGAIADLETRIELADGAVFLGWDVICLGRGAAGERFTRGRLRQRLEVWRAGERAWTERAVLTGDSPQLRSRVVLNSAPVFGTFLAAAMNIPDDLLAACRGVPIRQKGGVGAITRLPGILVARYLGDSAQAAREYLGAVWSLARPALLGREAVPPRIWKT